MKLSKIFLPLAAVAMLTASCTEEVKYTPAEPSPLAAYYFPTTNSDVEELVDGTTFFNVTIARSATEGELVLPIKHTIDPVGNFTVPETVTFADGEGVKTFKVEYDLNNIEVNKHYTLTLSLDGIENTPYSYGTLDIDIIYLPWSDLGEGWYRDGYLYHLFNGMDCLEYNVKIQAHPTTEGIYRVVNPYGPDVFPYDLGGGWLDQDCYMVIDASDPEKVFIDQFALGPIYSDYPVLGLSMAGMRLSQGQAPAPGDWGKLENGVITFPEKTLIVGLFDGGEYGTYYANTEGMFRVVLPGYEKPTEWAPLGMCEFTDGFYGKYLFGDSFQPTPYYVLVEQHMQEKGQYRIVDPYGLQSGYENVPEAPDQYFYIDAANKDCVFWNYETGSKYANVTSVFLGTLADYTLAKDPDTPMDEVVNAEIGGTFVDNVLTVPGEYCGAYALNRRAGFWPSGFEGKLDLNTAQPVEGEGEAASRKAPARLTLNKQYLVK